MNAEKKAVTAEDHDGEGSPVTEAAQATPMKVHQIRHSYVAKAEVCAQNLHWIVREPNVQGTLSEYTR